MLYQKRLFVALLLALLGAIACVKTIDNPRAELDTEDSHAAELDAVNDVERDSDLELVFPDQGDDDPIDDEASDGADAVACVEGSRRCHLASFEQCTMGAWVELEFCGAASLCLQEQGCVACNPLNPRVCVGDNVYSCSEQGEIGALLEKCSTQACVGGNCVEDLCPSQARPIYLMDIENQLLSFDPASENLEFVALGQVTCPAAPALEGWSNTEPLPYSMSVDRHARAWILYTSGEIFWVDLTDTALHCERSDFVPASAGMEAFGMSFVANEAGAWSETLFVAGGQVGQIASGNFGQIDPSTLQLSTIAPIPNVEQAPELTGSGNASWYGYFPGVESSYIAEIDKGQGTLLQTWSLPPLDAVAAAWAFAHWGGDFYIFVAVREGEAIDNRVIKLDPSTGQTETVLEDQAYTVVGAGVSICAPIN